MMNVLLTVDTEVCPLRTRWREEQLRQDVRRDIYAETEQGVFGLDYEIGVLNAFGLKAVFFVEPLVAEAVGLDPVKEIVRRIDQGGHEVQLHAHPEWLAWASRPLLQSRGPRKLGELSAEEQGQVVRLALKNLRDAGGRDIIAFRAGDFAADSHTLAALAKCGILWDSSYNCCFSHSLADVKDLTRCGKPTRVNGVWELPIAWWLAPPGGVRPAQITASSYAEMAGALMSAWSEGWKTFVIIFHTFEFLKKRRQRVERPSPDWLAVRRFRNLCRFLSNHRDKFRTCGFEDLAKDVARLNGSDGEPAPKPIASPVHRTAGRWLEQGLRLLT